MEKLKTIGGILLYIVIFAAMIALAVLFFLGAGWCSAHLLPFFVFGCEIAAAILFLILLPLSLIKKARGFTAVTILLISYLFGITVWMEGLLITLSTWGVVPAIVGLCFMGIGVVPIGMLSALFHGIWMGLLDMVILLALTFGCRLFSHWIAEKHERHQLETYETYEPESRVQL
jgi:hypothetical protein